MKIKKSIIFLFVMMMVVCFVPSIKASAQSPYAIKINKQQNCVTIYKANESGQYTIPYKSMICSTGSATPLGTFSVKDKIRWHELEGPVYGQYCSRITGHVLFHSVWYYERGKPATLSNYQYNQLGRTVSHGCVRLTVEDAKWIYENCPFGTTITIYNSKDPGPLGRPEAIKLPAGKGYDPTDVTDPSNPYNKKKPVIKGAKEKKITYASKYSPLTGVTAKNTTGMNATKKITLKIKRKSTATSKYETVKSISSRVPGRYKITYILKDEIGRTAKVTVKHKVLTKVFVSSFKLNRSSKTLYLGGQSSEKTYTLKVKDVLPKTASIKTADYSSDNPSVATVDANGKVVAKGAGTCTITAAAKDGSGVQAQCKITVCRYVKNIGLTMSSNVLSVGKTATTIVTYNPSDASNKGLNFISSDPSVASVDGNGVVTGMKAGTAVITATSTDKYQASASYTLTVVNEYKPVGEKIVQTLDITQGSALESVKTSLASSVTITDIAGNTANAMVTWDLSGFSTSKDGEFMVTGTVTLPSGWVGTPDVVKAKVNVVKIFVK